VLRRVTLIVALLLLLAAAILFTALNQQRFEIDVAFGRFVVSSGLALVIAFAAGLVAGALWRSTWIARLLAERGRLRHALRLAESRRASTPPPADAG